MYFTLRYVLRFTAATDPAQWTFTSDIDISVHPKTYVKNEVGRVNLKVGIKSFFTLCEEKEHFHFHDIGLNRFSLASFR